VIALAGLLAVAAGCGQPKRVVVKQSFEPAQTPHRIQGVTTRARQVVGPDCTLAIIYDVREATGTAFLVQSEVVHLRTRPVPRGTPYKIDCTGPLVVEIPTHVSDIRATSMSASGQHVALPAPASATSLPLAFGNRLRAEPGMRLAVMHWPGTRSIDHVELVFNLPRDRPLREKVLFTVSVSCGGSRYLQPILPLVASLARIPVNTIEPRAKLIKFVPPRIAGGIDAHAEATLSLSCAG
jgi:hypothetical protein